MTEVQSRRSDRAGRQGSIFPRNRRPAPLVRRIVLMTLLAACLGLVTISYSGGGGNFTGPQRVALQAVAPIETGLTRVWMPIENSWRWSTGLVNANNENPLLRDRIDQLETQGRVAQDVAAENSRLRDALALKERGRFPDGYNQVMGSVISRSPTAVDRSIVIDLGSVDGIEVNDPVMVTRGLIGRVEAVSSNAARVGLVINQSQAVSGSVVGSDATGVLRTTSTEGSPVMEMQYVSPRLHVAAGDVVVTSGWSTGTLTSVFPHGIPIGVVTSVGSSPADLYSTIQVTPFAYFDRIDEVTVLVPQRGVANSYVEPVAKATDLVAPAVPRPSAGSSAKARKRAAAKVCSAYRATTVRNACLAGAAVR